MSSHRFDEALVAKARELGPIVREHAGETERQRRLARPVLDVLVKHRLHCMFLPKSLGGWETDPLTCMRVVEELSAHDSIAGWMLMVANGSAWASARLPAKTAETAFRDLDDCIGAAAFQPPVEAREAPGGFRLTGRRPFASGAHAARYITLTGMIMDGPQPRMVNGMPMMVGAMIPREQVEIIDTWNGLGLRGSDSCDVSVSDVFVPADFTYPLAPVFEPNAHYRGPLYKLPMIGAIPFAHIAPLSVAVARSAIDAVKALCNKRVPMGSMVPLRDRGATQEKLGRAEGMLRAARALMYDAMADAWARVQAGETLTTLKRSDLLLAGTHAVQTSAEVTDAMYGLGGSSAVFFGHPLERLFRDAAVIRQHGFSSAARYETCAQVMLGLEPDLPLVHF
jgi:alkylation response protein AidB-like acyl-CoA dehydrogenase